MTMLKTLIPLVLLVGLLLVACDQQPAQQARVIPETDKAWVTFAVEGMT